MPRRTVRERDPYNAGTPMEALCRPITPTDLFYVRNHFDVPEIEADEWRLRFGGVVERPLELALSDLRALPPRTLAVTLECAGNGRTRMRPVPSGTPWAFDAVSTARFTGTSLVHLLDAAGVRRGAVEVLFVGADGEEADPRSEAAFARSLPLDVARHPDTILAWGMNGSPLRPQHGHPVRLVVPGWYAVASVKWVARIDLLDAPFRGHWQTTKYVYDGMEGVPDGTPVEAMRVRAAIARPADGTSVPAGPVVVRGTAWSGAGRIRKVEVRVDDGAWVEAALGRSAGRHGATPWTWTWRARKGRRRIEARATDETGATQPLVPVWNHHGYGNNVVQRVEIDVD
ncbi:MAG: sulfite oxidase [Gemmatimonadetes bacterium]|nr:sulfite oxidase [Gemmatimonadota bacterium]